jgi:hypothetical protein
MKRILLFTLLLGTSTFGFSQTPLELPGFETWENSGAPNQEPTQWSSLKTSDAPLLWGTTPQVMWQSSTAHSGTSSVQLVVAPYNFLAGVSPNGTMTNGQVHAEITAANGYVFTNTSDPQWNTPCTDRPDSLVGWLWYTPQGGDKGKVEAILHDNTLEGRLPHNGTYTHWVGKARHEFSATNTGWVRFSVPFNYFNTNSPDYILLVATSGDSLLSVAGSEVLFDDFELIYNPLIATVTPAAAQNINEGANGNVLTVNETSNAGVTGAITREWKYSTTSGSGYTSFGTPETGTTYTPNFATADIYYVVCETDFDGQVVTSNEVEIVVIDPLANTVTISPSATQNLLTGQDGTMLTATESPSSASSREWQWSTTSGSGFASFGTPETGTSYTPNFANLGTYYVICESDFAGDVQVSNEVTIMVPSSAGIDENGLTFNIFKNGANINLVFSEIENGATFNLFTLEGKQVYTSVLNSTSSEHPVPDTQGIYVYQVISGDKVVTNKIKL